MLTRSSIAATAPLAQLLASRGVALEAHPNSILGGLVQASTFHLQVRCALEGEGADVPELSTLDEYADHLQESSATEVLGENEHDNLMENSVQNASDGMGFTVRTARDVVVPQIERIVSATQEALDDNALTTLNPINIVQQEYPPIIGSALVPEIAAPYTEVRAALTPLTVRIPVPENLLDYARTGVAAYDAEIDNTLQALGPDGLANLWNQLFGGGAAVLTDIANLNDVSTYALAVLSMVIVQNVQQNTPAGINESNGSLGNYLSNLRAQIGQLLCRMPERRAAHLRSNRLVVSAPSAPVGEVVVNGDVYQDYLQRGGTPEAIYGSLVQRQSVAPVTDLIASRESFERAWSLSQESRQRAEVSRRVKVATEALRLSVASIIVDIPEEDLVVPRKVMHQRLDAALARPRPELVDDLYGESRHVLTEVVYPHTGVENLLQAVDAEAADVEDPAMDEAVIHAAVDQIVDWAMNNVQQVQAVDTVIAKLG